MECNGKDTIRLLALLIRDVVNQFCSEQPS